MKLYRQLKNLLKRGYAALLVFYAAFLARQLDKCLQRLGKLGVLDLSQPLLALPAPIRPAPKPTFTDLTKTMDRKQVTIPYVPAWVRPSFKDPTLHPGYNGFKAASELVKDILPASETISIDKKE